MRRRDFIKAAGLALAVFVPTAAVASRTKIPPKKLMLITDELSLPPKKRGKSWFSRSFDEVARELNRVAHKGLTSWKFNSVSLTRCLYSFQGGDWKSMTESELCQLLHQWDRDQGNERWPEHEFPLIYVIDHKTDQWRTKPIDQPRKRKRIGLTARLPKK